MPHLTGYWMFVNERKLPLIRRSHLCGILLSSRIFGKNALIRLGWDSQNTLQHEGFTNVGMEVFCPGVSLGLWEEVQRWCLGAEKGWIRSGIAWKKWPITWRNFSYVNHKKLSHPLLSLHVPLVVVYKYSTKLRNKRDVILNNK